MLGLLLARAGVRVVVLEKHGDFLRDFRGDTIHPSILEILDQLGLAERFLALPHSEISDVAGTTADNDGLSFTFRRLKTKFPFIAFVPQWDFLRFITGEARKYASFSLMMNTEVTGLLFQDGIVRGVRCRTADGEREMRAALTIGTDGRTSNTRESARLPIIATSPLMDVLWFRVSKKPDEPDVLGARLGVGQLAVLIDRREYWQVAYLIPKGEGEKVRARGLSDFRAQVSRLLPEMADRVSEIQRWDQVKLLTVKSDRLAEWHRPGYLAIGDAAHAMSPIGGIGINIAIHDAVATANILWEPLRRGTTTSADLASVQWERETPVRIVQAMQTLIQNRLIGRFLTATTLPRIPAFFRVLSRTPILRDIPARFIAFGIGRPHVQSPHIAPLASRPQTSRGS
ncbi:MAG: FAD-dependent oxidoreductase [Gemmatimonadota bacterium]|nr:FAD-dependent oxidoreductase [Gemmatimonadota bacterium]